MPNETKTITYWVAGEEVPSLENATYLYNILKRDGRRKLKIAQVTTTTTTEACVVLQASYPSA